MFSPAMLDAATRRVPLFQVAARVAKRNALWLGPLMLLSACLNTWINITLARRLGAAGFGEWSLVVATTSWIVVLRSAVGSDLIVKAAADERYAARIFAPAFVALTIGSLAIGAMGLAWHLLVDPMSATGVASLLATAAFVFGSLSVIPVSLFAGGNRMQWNVVDSAASAGILLGLVWLGTQVDVNAVAATYLISYAAVSTVTLVIAAWLIRPRLADISSWPHALSLNDIGHLLAINWLLNLHWTIELFILKLAATDQDVGLYNAAFKLAIVFRLFPMMLLMSIVPEVARRMAARDWPFLQYVWSQGLRWLLIASTIATLGLLTLSRELVQLMYDPEYAPSAAVLMVLSAALIPLSCASVTQSMLYASGRYRDLVGGLIAAVSIQLIADVGLIPTFGARGAAGGFLIAECSLAVWFAARGVKVFKSWPVAVAGRTFLCSIGIVVVAAAAHEVAVPSLWKLSLLTGLYMAMLSAFGCLSPDAVRTAALLIGRSPGLER